MLDPIGPNGVPVIGNNLLRAPERIFNGVFNFQPYPLSSGLFGSLDINCVRTKRFSLDKW